MPEPARTLLSVTVELKAATHPELVKALRALQLQCLKLRTLNKLRPAGPFLFPTVEIHRRWGSDREHRPRGEEALFLLFSMQVPRFTAGYKMRLSPWVRRSDDATPSGWVSV